MKGKLLVIICLVIFFLPKQSIALRIDSTSIDTKKNISTTTDKVLKNKHIEEKNIFSNFNNSKSRINNSENNLNFDKELYLLLAKKEERITNLKSNNKKLVQLILALIFVITIIVFLMFYFNNKFRRSKKARLLLIEQNRNILKQKNIIQTKNSLLSEQNEEIKMQQNRIIKQKNELIYSNKQYEDSLLYASYIQNAILQVKHNISPTEFEHFVFFKPIELVSGDFYFIRKIEHFIIFAAADCTGHGVPGAFLSMLGIAFLNEVVRKREITHAGEVLEELRFQFKNSLNQTGKQYEQKDGMDMAFCILDTNNNKLEYAGANSPLFLFRENKLKEIIPTKNPISIYVKEEPFKNNLIQLQKNDILYIFSDGYQDQFGGKRNKKLKQTGFKKVLQQIHTEPIANQKEYLLDMLIEWQGNNEQIDDIIVMGVKI